MLAAVIYVALLIILLAALVSLVVFGTYQASPVRIGYVPLRRRAVSHVVAALGESIDRSRPFYDLGCGDGRILAAMLSQYPGLSATGFEINPVVAFAARLRLRRFGSRARIVRRNLEAADLSRPGTVFTYLNPYTMRLLEGQLHRQANGLRLVSCDFPLPNRQANQTLRIAPPGHLAQHLYIYDYPPRPLA